MKKKWKSLSLAFIIGAGLTMASCSDDIKKGPEVVDEPDGNLTYGFLSTQLGAEAGIGTKAYGDEDKGLPQEQYVKKIRLVYYDAKTKIAEYAFTYDVAGIHSGAGQDFTGPSMLDPNDYPTDPLGYVPGFNPVTNSTVFVPKAEKVQVKDYKLLVLINPSADVITRTKAIWEKDGLRDADGNRPAGNEVKNEYATNLDNFYNYKAQISANNLTNFIGTANFKDAPEDFFMSNAKGIVDVPVANIFHTELEAYQGRVKVAVDRAVAKVSMKADLKPSTINAAWTDTDNAVWKLDVTNLSTYYLRHPAKTSFGTMEALATPRKNLYAEDTNGDKYSWERYLFMGLPTPSDLVTTSKANIQTYFNYIDASLFDNSANTYKVGKLTQDWLDECDSEYALENTMEADEQYEDVTTAVILKTKYVPRKSAVGTAMTETTPYYVWNGKVFTADDLNDVKSFDASTATDAEKEKMEMFFTLQKYLIDNATAGDELEVSGNFGTDYSYSGDSKKVGALTFNKDGMNYYRILIRHFNDDLQPETMAYGRYGIVRNNWYRLTLRELLGPGDIAVPEPKGPDDKENWWTAVDIEVLPWVLRDQDVIGGGYY
ncbi:hypothetical protein M2101_001558 [Parabacteroides sp. PM5-20]|uniref:Mfa1 family fimbria major subunit n=1 Tax=unclassified Parabacteroides TaxID=2649774 RepID=UPI0013D2965A|nr:MULTISPECIES: Mfa1 family fimbria major subunit [unclassified Parabacteroides]MDH6534882.1 hypothetical protein [Parabacteroides sp. PM5-20]